PPQSPPIAENSIMSSGYSAAKDHGLDFDDLTPIELPVKYKGKNYVLREADEGAATQYRNLTIKAARMEDGKITGMDGVADAEPFLISLCLYEAREDASFKDQVVAD